MINSKENINITSLPTVLIQTQNNDDTGISAIQRLPVELQKQFIHFSDISDILKFARTNKYFNRLVNSSNSFWDYLIKRDFSLFLKENPFLKPLSDSVALEKKEKYKFILKKVMEIQLKEINLIKAFREKYFGTFPEEFPLERFFG